MPTPANRAASAQEIATYSDVRQSFSSVVPVPAGRFQFHAAFDGTWNDKSNLSLSKTNQPTNVAEMANLVRADQNPDVLSKYYPGVGTSGAASQYIGGSISPQPEITAKANQAFADLTDQANKWAAANPGQALDISVSMTSFSRGAGSALAFAQMLYEKGIPDTSSPAYTVEIPEYQGEVTVIRTEIRYERNLIEPGQIPVTAMLMYDPVLAGITGPVQLAPNVQSCLQLVAKDEHRSLFPSTEFGDPASPSTVCTVVRVAGAHTDIGGGYDNGLGAMNLEIGRNYLESKGTFVAPIPESLQPMAPENMVVHNSSVGIFAGDWVEQRPVRQVWQPDAPMQGYGQNQPQVEISPLGDGTYVRSTIGADGQVSAEVLNSNGAVLLRASQGDTLLRDPGTGQITVTNSAGDITGQYVPPAAGNPSIAQEPAPAPPTPEPAPVSSTQAPSGDPIYEQILDVFTNTPIPAPGPGLVVAGEGTLTDGGYITGWANGGQSLSPTLTPTPIGDPDFYNDDYVYTPTGPAPNAVNWETLSQGVSLINTLMSLGRWDDLSDIQRLGLLAGGYQTLAGLNGVQLTGLPGSLPGVIGLLGALDSGNPLAIASAGAQLGSRTLGSYAASLTDSAWAGLSTGELTGDVAVGMLDDAIGLASIADGLGQAVPFLNLMLALESDNPWSIAASVAAFIPGIGPLISGVITVLGMLFGDDGPPMQVGHVTATWDDAGQLGYTIQRDEAGGADPAMKTARGLATWLDEQVAEVRDADGNRLLDIIPGKLPGVGFRLEPSQDNFDRVHLYYTDENGQQQTRYYDEDGNQVLFDGRSVPGSRGLGADYAQFSQVAIAPAFVVQMARNTFKEQVSQAQQIEEEVEQLRREADAIAPREVVEGHGQDAQHYTADSTDPERYASLTARIQQRQADASGIRHDALVQMQATPSVADLKQDAQLSPDGQHQSLVALTFSLDVSSAPMSPVSKPVLANLDADDYLEQVDWVGANQALLGIDLDADGKLSATELLTGHLDWLDANHDGRIDAKDPGFAAIRVWVDINGDADSRAANRAEDGKTVIRDETTSLRASGIVAINIKGNGTQGPSIEREGGQTQTLTEQTLTGDVRGVIYSTVQNVAGVLQTTEQEDGSGHSVLLAANKRTYDGMTDHMHGGGIAGDTGEPRVRDVQADDPGLRSLTFLTAESRAGQSATRLDVGDGRVSQGAAGMALQGQDDSRQSHDHATQADVVGLAQVVATPARPIGPRETVVVEGVATPATAAWEPPPTLTADAPSTMEGQDASTQNSVMLSAGAIGSGEPGIALAGQGGGTQPAGAPRSVHGDGRLFVAPPPTADPIVVARGDARVQSGPRLEQTVQSQGQVPQQVVNQPLAYVPVAAVSIGQQRREMTADMIRSAGSGLLGPSGSPLIAVAMGAAGLALPPVAQALPGEGGVGATSPAGASWLAGNSELQELSAPIQQGFVATPFIANNPPSAAAPPLGMVFRHVNLGDLAAGGPVGGTGGPPAAGTTDATPVPWTRYDNGDHGASTGGAEGSAGAQPGGAGVSALANLPGPSNPVAVVLQRPVIHDAQLVGDEDAGLMLDLDALLASGGSPGHPPGSAGLSIAGVGDASHGRVSLRDGQVVFVPEANYHGPASFSYTVGDAYGLQTTAIARLDVRPVNDAPIVPGGQGGGREDTALSIDPADLLAGATDVEDGHPGLAVTAVGAPEHGSVGLEGGRIVFRPDANYHGPASFAYTVTDREGASTIAVAQLNIAAVNDAPIALGEQLSSNEDEGLIFPPGVLLANDRDADGDPLSISRVGGAEQGTAFLDGQGQVRFIPTPNYSGPASFTYWVSDGQGGETAATVQLTIEPVNDVPLAVGEYAAADEDVALVFTTASLLANDNDIDGPFPLQIVSVGDASHGQVALEPQPDGSQRVVFTPQPNYFGPASFRYAVSDGAGGVTYATVQLDLAEINDVPAATPDAHAGAEDSVIRIPLAQLLGNDVDPDTGNAALDPAAPSDVLTVTAVGNALHGNVALGQDPLTQQPCVEFTPDTNYFGPASFMYTIADGRGGSSAALVTLNVVAVNDAPETAGEVVASNEDAVLVIDPAALLANDMDIDTPHANLRITAVGPASHGSAVLQANGLVAFTPEADYVGPATFEYTVSDGAGGATQATATVMLANVNDAPRLYGDTIAGAEDMPLDIGSDALLTNDEDIDTPHGNLVITAVGNAVHGTVQLQAGGSIRFTPDADYNESQGPASFEYTVADGDGGVTVGVATLTVSAVNDAPVATGEVVAAQPEDSVLAFAPADLLANDSDVDNTPEQLTISAVGGAVHGSVSLQADGSVVFVPELNYSGTASFAYTVADGAGGSTQAVVNLSFNPVNDAPTLTNDVVAAVEDTPTVVTAATVLANDTDVDSPHGALQVTAVGNAQHGIVVLEAGGQVRFTPDANFNGMASFSYTVTDGAGGSSQGTAEVAVAAVNDTPVAQADALASQLEDTNLVLSAGLLLANDIDVDAATNGQTLHIASVSALPGQTHGSVSVTAGGDVLFVPDADYAGPVSFSYTTSDGSGGTSASTVGFDLANVNDAPVLGDDLFSAKGQTYLVIQPGSLLANDSDPDAPYTHDVLTVTAVSDAQNGQVILQGDGSILFTPDVGFAGLAQFTYEVSDGNGASSAAIAQVETVNVAPVAVPEWVQVQEDTITLFDASLLLGNDRDLDNPLTDLHIVSVGDATHGNVSLNASGQVVYAPDLNYYGGAQFSYTISDGEGGTSAATVQVQVNAVNDAPTTIGESIALQEDQAAVLSTASLLANDTDVETPGALSIIGVGSAQHGAVQLAGPNVIFTPQANFYGVASFNYTVADSQGGQSVATATINYAPVNDAPVVNSEVFDGLQDTQYIFSTGALLANDTDAETPYELSVVNAYGGTNASIYLQGASLVFTPTPGFSGYASFNYTVSDPQGATSQGTAYVNLAHVNHNPVATDDGFDAIEDVDTVISFGQLTVNDFDVDSAGYGDALTIASVFGAVNGSVGLGAGVVYFTPSPNYSGPASFGYQLSDGKGGSAFATAYLTVQPTNDAPVVDQVIYGADSTTGTVIAHDVDGPGGLSYSIIQNPLYGVASIDGGGNWSYFGNLFPIEADDPFLVQVSDGIATQWVNVYAHHAAPPPIDHGGGGPGVGSEPVVIDLGGDGVRLLSPQESNMFIDLDGDGLRERVGWAAPEDAVLAYDRNRDGMVDLPSEVSFVNDLPGAKTDLEGLRAFDTDGDGKLTAADQGWDNFGLFQDVNNNGAQDAGDFTPLAQTPIVAIGLDRQGSPMINNGNLVHGTSAVELADGSQVQAHDARFSAVPWESTGLQVPVAAATTSPDPVVATPIPPVVPPSQPPQEHAPQDQAPSAQAQTPPVQAPQAPAPIVSAPAAAPAAATPAEPPEDGASDADIAAQAHLFNNWSNTAPPVNEPIALAFVPMQDGTELAGTDASGDPLAANDPIATSPVADPRPAVAVG